MVAGHESRGLRIEVGNYRCETSDGREFNVDQPLSQSQVDLLAQVLDAASISETRAFAVELNEGGCVVEYYRTDDTGRLYIDDDRVAAARVDLTLRR